MKPIHETRAYGPAPLVKPRDAATLILLDKAGGARRVLMGKRSARLAFMPGMFVFPGGRTERSDLTAPRTGALHEADARRLVAGMGARGSLRRAEALALSAIRETNEETGLLLGRDGDASRGARAESWKPFADSGVLPDLSALRFVARAITPPGRVRRFDTRFFVADAGCVANPEGLIANPAEELDEVRWIDFGELDAIEMASITALVLKIITERLAEDPDLSRDVPVPFIRARHRRMVSTME